MVVLRLKRMGRSHRAFFRLNAMDQRSPRDGRVIEELGWYDPIAAEDKQLNLKTDRIDYWLSVGAQPSETVRSLLRRIGVDPKSGKKLVPGAASPGAATPGAATPGAATPGASAASTA